jgi:xanthine dehydrogenase accessory factor
MATLIAGEEMPQVGAQVLVEENGASFPSKFHTDQAIEVLLTQAAKLSFVAKAPAIETPKGQAKLMLFINPILPSPRLVLVGAGHIAIALASVAKGIGFRTVVIDPRRVFATPERFPLIDRLIQDWPQTAFEELSIDASSAVATLSHDPKIDDPALSAALRSPAFYIGALGSRNSHNKRLTRLQQLDFTTDELARIKGPIGLEIGAITPEEIALAVMAEIVAAYRSN